MNYDNFTIAFEIELESNDTNINIPEYFFNTLTPFSVQESVRNQKKSKEKELVEEKREYATNKIKRYLPNFYNKYNNKVNFTFDRTLTNGIEISHKTYCHGINEAIEYLLDFYKDYNIQDFWKMNDNTSVQINIGVDNNFKWNIVKGVLSIDDDYIFDGMSNKRRFKYKDILEGLNNINEKNLFNNIKKYGAKSFNLNIDRIRTSNYLEFRYIGGDVSFNFVKERLLYFCEIVDIMTS